MIVEFLVVLVAAKIAAEVAERLRVPAVLGEIVAGILVGPSVLALVGEGEVLHFLAELGVILLLFEVGLETDLDELRSVGRASLLVAIMGVALPFGLGFAGMLAIGEEAGPAVFIGAALTATSVGITARVFGDLRALATFEARTVLGAAVADDVLGLVILTVVVRLTSGETLSLLGVGGVVLAAAGFVVIATALGLRAAAPVFRAIDRNARSSGALIVAALIGVLALAGVAAAAGLAPIIGAFVAGMAVRRSDAAERVRRDTGPLAHVLVPVFFLQIGIATDLSSFTRPGVLGVAGLMLVAAVAGKLLAAFGAMGAPGDKALIGIGMLPRGEVGLIFAGIGLAGGVLTDDVYAALLVVVLATTLVTPPLLRWRIESIRHRPRIEEEGTPVPEGGWLAALDGVIVLRGTPPAELALVLGLEAAVLAAAARPGPRLLQWFLTWRPTDQLDWDDAARAQLLAVLRAGNARSWRFLDAVGLLDATLPELAARMQERRSDASELDPARVFEWATVEALRATAGDEATSDEVLMAALIADISGDHLPSDEAAIGLASRLGLRGESQREVAFLVAELGRLRAAAVRPDALDEPTVLALAAHLRTRERARALYLLERASGGIEVWERQRLDELHERLHVVLGEPDQAEARRFAAAQLVGDATRSERIRVAPRHWLLTQSAEAIARQVGLLDPRPRRGDFRVHVEGERVDVATIDRRGLLAEVTGALASAGVEVRSAATATWSDGTVVMSFRAFDHEPDADRIRDRLASATQPAVVPVPDVHLAFDHGASPWYTLLDAVAADRPGLLAALAAACAAAGASIHSVVAKTADGVAHDRFELVDGRGQKLDGATCESIRRLLGREAPPPRRSRALLTRTKR